jgi:hypothetical protein
VSVNSGLLVTTASPHGWSTGQYVTFSGLKGITFVNGDLVDTDKITVLDANTFFATPAVSGTYISGGQASSSVCMMLTGSSQFGGGLRQVKVVATGVTLQGPPGGFSLAGAGTKSAGSSTGTLLYSARTSTVAAGSTSVTLVPPSQTSIFTAATYALMGGIDLQGYGYPQNLAVFEYVYITAINSITGVITLSAPLQYSYESTWPLWSSGDQFHQDQGGPATLFWLDPSWNVELEIDGAVISSAGQTYTNGRSVTYNNVTFTGGNCGIPTQNQNWSVVNSTMIGCDMEVDKLVTNATLNNVTIHNIYFQSASVVDFTIENGSVVTGGVSGTPIGFICSNSTLAGFGLGAYAYGASQTASLINCSVTNWSLPNNTLIGSGSFSMANGVITWPNSNFTPTWAAPGNILYWTGANFIAGYPLTILDLTQDSTNTYISTTGSEIPVIPLGSNAEVLRNFPVRSFTCTFCTGSATSTDLSQATPGAPLFSYTSRTFNPVTSQSLLYAGGYALGALVSLTIDVVTPYTGVKSSLYLSALAQFHYTVLLTNSNTDLDYNPIVNLKIAGARVITPGGVVGAQTGDSGLVIGGPAWMDAEYSPFISSTIASECASTPSVCPVVTITIQTNQAQNDFRDLQRR